jgi:hypothetical protein
MNRLNSNLSVEPVIGFFGTLEQMVQYILDENKRRTMKDVYFAIDTTNGKNYVQAYDFDTSLPYFRERVVEGIVGTEPQDYLLK